MELSLTKLPWYAQLGAFVALGVGACGAFWYYYERPAQVEMTARRTTLASIKADITKGLTTARQLPQFQAEVSQLEARLSDLKSILPEEKDAADLLRRMQSVATQSNLTIKGFKPQPIVTKQLHAEWPIALELTGTYHNLAIFFDRVSKFTRIVNINTLDVKAIQKPEPNSTISATCVATTFVLLDATARAAAKTAGAKPGGKGA